MKAPGPRPRVGVSACLLGREVRWDGGHRRDGWIAGRLGARVEIVPVCPEMEAGLGVPRPPIRLVHDGRGVRLVEPAAGTDLTDRMRRFSEARVRALDALGLSGFVLKGRSPSCGPEGVEVWRPGARRPRREGRGLFAEALLRRLPGLPVATEEGLRDPGGRRAFLARVLDYHRDRAGGAAGGGATVNRWLVKTDPETYSFADLLREGTTRWEGVRNATALRHLRAMAAGDEVLVYETGAAKAVVGTATVARGPYADPKEKDPKAVAVDLRAGKALPSPVTLAAVKADPAMRDSLLVRMGRLSVMPVTAAQWARLVAPGGKAR